MKSRWPRKFDELRQKLVLTPEEKRVIIFILAAFLLGVGAKCYRDKHPPAAVAGGAEHSWRKQPGTAPSAAAPKQKRGRKPRGPKPTPTVAAGVGEELEPRL